MKKLGLLALTTSVVVSSFAFLASNASAIPVFARKYNTQCNMCHTVPPRLNKFGVAFKQNGFELPPGTILPESEVWGNQVLSNDEPKAVVGAGLPFMIRTGLALRSGGGTMAPLGFAAGEFGLIGGGSVETKYFGLGYWIDAPSAVIGALELDFNLNPLFKVTVANAIAPNLGYGIGLPVMAFGTTAGVGAPVGATRNEAATTTNGGFVWGNNSLPGLEVRGTTNPETGLGFNYVVGYLAGGVAVNAPAGSQNPSTLYLGGSYFIDAANTNIAIGYSSEKVAGAIPVAPLADPTQLFVTAAINPGENLQATLSYNSFGGTNAGAFAGYAAPVAGGGYANVLTFAPEYLITPEWYVGGRYSVANGAGVGTNGAAVATPNATAISIGFGYKILQNVQYYVNYNSVNTGAAVNANQTTFISGIDFVM